MSEQNSSAIEAVILAGGIGTRLRPYTHIIPKPLVPIHGLPVIEIVLHQLARFGFRNICITLGYQAELIKAHIANGERLGLNITYSKEEKPLGTAGPLGIIDNLAENFLVLNGDLITTLDYRELFNHHLSNSKMLTIAAHEKNIPIEFGVIQGTDGNVTGYVEKPKLQYRVSMGIYAFNRQVVSMIHAGERFDFPNLVLELIKQEKHVGYYSFDGYWVDVGSQIDYLRAIDEFPRMKAQLLGE